ncbi:MAG: Rrf2 family transcriptional regulator [Candidatus Omnitrophica bacterium]|nr:Rrf2 family transcriptional regulator [Candidatus Omnitrophota bacterium]MDD4012689.1 Rrf2 family transcriptional regulator [Candidatus Omnitrophota bacterium]
MKLIKRDTDYAIRALCHIASAPERSHTAKELEKALDLPLPFLRKLLQKLGKKGLLRSIKGRSGGFKLTAPAERISVLQVIEIFQGKLKLTQCFFRKKVCPRQKICKLKKRMDSIEKTVLLSIERIKISDIV